jgi:HAMP domain-containing protein
MDENRGPAAPLPGASSGRGPEEGETTIERKQAFAPLTTMIPTPSSGTEAIRKAEKAVALPSAANSPLVRRIFLAIAGIIALVVILTLAVTSYSAERTAQKTVGDALTATQDHIGSVMDGLGRQIETATRIYVGNRVFSAAIEQASDSSTADYYDQAQSVQGEIGASWVQLTNRSGILLGKSDEPAVEHRDLSQTSLVGRALGGEIVHGFGITSDSVLFTAVGVPIPGTAAGVVVGTVMAAVNITDSTADRIRQATQSEIVFYTVDKEKRLHVAGSSRGLPDHAATAAVLEPLVFNTAPDSTGAIGMSEGMVGDAHYLWNMSPVRTASGTPIGGVVALRNKDLVLAPFRRMQYSIAGAGVGGLLLAFVLALVIAGRISKPVRALAIATQRASEGDYAADIPPGGKDEIGTLSTAFKRLLGDLREKQALVDFLQNPVEGATLPLQAATLKMRAGRGEIPTLEPGRLLGNRYEIKEVLGEGGMGMVYKAADRELGDIVAIKTLRPEMLKADPEALNRFRSEIRLARLISHRNVVRTHDIGEKSGLYYITMEFVEGKSLKDLIISRGRLPVGVVLPIAKQLCRALEVAHEAGVIHRDIKPQNMVVEGDGVLKVMDFGIARLAQRKPDAGLTMAGMVVGTPEYMAPEQLLGDDIDVRADIYAAGVVLYEALTGRVPHTAETPITLIAKVLEETPVTPRGMNADVPQPLSDLVMRAMAKDRNDRPGSAAELLRLLDL